MPKRPSSANPIEPADVSICILSASICAPSASSASHHPHWIADPKTQSITIYILPEGGQEYVLHGQFGSADTLTSKILAGLELSVAPLFAAENI